MKTIKALLFLALCLFIGCSEDDESTSSIVIPGSFTIDIPEALSTMEDGTLRGRLNGDGDGIIEGNEIYESVRFFIAVGEQSAEIVEDILVVARALERENIVEFTFTSDDDGRNKRLELARDVTRDGQSYQFEMVMFDVEDNAQAIQLLWNTNPVEGIAILRPFDFDRTAGTTATDAFIRIDYSEISTEYEATMMVSISGLPTIENGDINNMQMFVGRSGDIVEVMGNSNHPNIIIVDDAFTGGRNYAFVGRGNEASDQAVINLGLPPSSVTTSDIFDNYSVFAVLEAEINNVGITDQDIIDQILQNATSPAYFNEISGFIDSGPDNAPSGFTDEFIDLSTLSPFIPNDISNLQLDFIQ